MASKRKWHTKSVLVVDDDPEVLDEMVEALRDHGLTVHHAGNARVALSLADKHRPAFVLMDFNLPGIDGLETVSVMRKFLPEAVYIMISGVDEFCRLATTRKTGTFAILKKPVAMDSIAKFIRNKLDYMSSNLNVRDMLTA